MGDEVEVEEVFPTTVGRRYTITIPLNVRKLLESRGIYLTEGDQVKMAFVKKESNSGNNGRE